MAGSVSQHLHPNSIILSNMPAGPRHSHLNGSDGTKKVPSTTRAATSDPQHLAAHFRRRCLVTKTSSYTQSIPDLEPAICLSSVMAPMMAPLHICSLYNKEQISPLGQGLPRQQPVYPLGPNTKPEALTKRAATKNDMSLKTSPGTHIRFFET